MAFVFEKTRHAKVVSYVALNSERAIFDGDNTQQYSYTKSNGKSSASSIKLSTQKLLGSGASHDLQLHHNKLQSCSSQSLKIITLYSNYL